MTERNEFDDRLRENASLIACLCGTEARIFVMRGDALVACSNRDAEALASFEHARPRIDAECAAFVDGLHWWREALALGSQASEAEVYVSCAIAPGSIAAAAVAATDRILGMVCRGIERDWLQQETIANLSVELGNRYEELNLLYGIDDSLGEPGDEPAQAMIGAVLDNCLDFLNIDGAAIHVPDHEIELYRYCDEAATVLRFGAADGLGAVVQNHVRSGDGPLVVNGSDTESPKIAGNPISFRLLASPVREGPHRIAGVLCFLRTLSSEPFSTSDRKIAEVVAAEVSKALDARYDAVTGLLKRGPFEKYVSASLRASAGTGGVDSLVQIDIDRFSLINESCGHDAGDRLLRQAGGLTRGFAPDGATVARLGADEYGVFLPKLTATQAQVLAEDVVSSISGSRFVSREKTFEITVSIGITEISAGKPLSTALTEVDIACGVAKEMGGNRIRVFTAEDAHLQSRHAEMQWASKIRTSIEQDRFELFGQAINRTDDPFGTPAHFEVLLRLFDDENTIVSPAIFIPAAERYGVMERIDRMVVEKAIAMFAGFQARGVKTGISINISAPSMCNESFRGFVIESVLGSGVRPESLSFEITETATMSNLGDALAFIEALSKVGCRFSLDDFGSGMSSYAYLRTLPVDYVKIDGSFVRDMATDSFNRSIVESIHQISHATGKLTVAEFVEDERTLALLADIGVDLVQGYVMDRPEPLVEKLERLVPPIASVV